MQRSAKFIKGKISVTKRGFAFVSPENKKKLTEDVFIPASQLKGALDGDFVEAKVLSKSRKGYEGCVTKIIKRSKKKIVGTVVDFTPQKQAVIFSLAAGEGQNILLQKEKKQSWKIGDRIVIKIEKQTEDTLLCKALRYLGSIDDPLIDTDVAIEEFDITSVFPQAAIKEAKAWKKKPFSAKGRKDYRKLHCITIDPIKARDYDDALSIEKKGKEYTLGVHIADVSHFVTPGSSLDKSAYKRCNSTYFIDRVVPMLPEELSNDLCSLVEKQPRYAVSVFMRFNAKGKMLDYRIERSLIENKKRFTYEEAYALLQSKTKSPHRKTLETLVELFHELKRLRKERGSLELSLPEIRLDLGKDGIPKGQERIEYDITHQLVEECMLKANETVSRHLDSIGRPSIFRVHEEPQAENFEDFLTYARVLGFQAPAKPTIEDLQNLFMQAQDSPSLEQLAIRYIRSMKIAIYSPENIGHYGLCLDYYTHFTSPIRRYSDLVIHRLLFDEDYSPKLQDISDQCSEKERTSFKAEMSVLKIKKLRYLDKITQKNPNKEFEAIITQVKQWGISFDLKEIHIDGFIPISELGDEYFEYHDNRQCLRGSQTGVLYQPGTEITVCLQTIDLVFSECTWLLID